jgi:hypothetical protein
MVLVSHKYQFIYIKNFKVAGSSVESFFGKFCINPKKQYNFNDSISQQIDNFGIIGSRMGGISDKDKWYNHKTAKSIKEDLGELLFNKYLKFCVIRNPYDVMVSSYFWNKSTLPFKEYAKKTVVSNLPIHCIEEKSVCNYFIRYENLEKDIIELCRILNIKNFNLNDLPKHKSGIRNKNIHYRNYYDEETRKIVYENHKKELELYGYEF